MIFELARKFDREAIEESARLAGIATCQVAVQASPSRYFRFEEQELHETLARIASLSRSYKQKVSFLPENLLSDTSRIYGRATRASRIVRCAHRSILRIDPLGNVIPCFTFRSSFGNIFHDQWSEINMRAGLFWTKLEQKNLAPVCDTCFRLEYVG
jgi:MoaA/NifB/PqqE/SkfB family radical SAM enzyme